MEQKEYFFFKENEERIDEIKLINKISKSADKEIKKFHDDDQLPKIPNYMLHKCEDILFFPLSDSDEGLNVNYNSNLNNHHIEIKKLQITGKILRSNFFYNKRKDTGSYDSLNIIENLKIKDDVEYFEDVDCLHYDQDYYLDFEDHSNNYNPHKIDTIQFNKANLSNLRNKLLKLEKKLTRIDLNVFMLIPKIRNKQI